MSDAVPDPHAPVSLTKLTLKGILGGTLMGLANLVPGISGGTMLLAAGIYPRFIQAISEVTRLRFGTPSLVTLASVGLAAAVAVAAFAGPIKDLVVHQRWIMYSIFIGLTLGGVPILWRLIGKLSGRVTAAAAGGVAAMALIAFSSATGPGSGEAGPVGMFLAGIAGASAMILPGVSGGYLLLVLGVYVPLLAAISAFVGAARAFDLDVLLSIGLTVILPVGAGVLIGIAGVSNLLEWLLERFEKATLGFLLGLLLGAVLGLWPFQQGVAPAPGETLKGQVLEVGEEGELLYSGSRKVVQPDDWPTAYFRPAAWQVAAALGLIVASFGVTTGIGRLGKT